MSDESDVNGRTPAHIGIVAGTAEGAALCYRSLQQEALLLMAPGQQPEVTVHSYPLCDYLDLIDRDDWKGVGRLMSRSASKLVQLGANMIICPNNTLHQAFDTVESPVPWIHIATAVVDETVRQRFHSVGILGTRIVIEGAIYRAKLQRHGIESIIPALNDRIRIQRLIRTELIGGRYTLESRRYLEDVIGGLAARGAEAVILGCTELPVLLSEANAVIPLLDSTRLLAMAALEHSRLIHAASI